METITKLNLGCGKVKLIGWVNVDNWGDVDLKHDLNQFPYPWDDGSVDEILMNHVLEHIPDWWDAFKECSRILKPGGKIRINVPDDSSKSALTYRDHHHVFSPFSFFGTVGTIPGTNNWAANEDRVPLKLISYHRVPHKKYNWMTYFGFRWLLAFCADHMRNFIHEQRFVFQKV